MPQYITNCPSDWRRVVFLQADPASAQSRLDIDLIPFSLPASSFAQQLLKLRTEGVAGSPFQADREDTAGLTPVHAYYSTQWIYHELREMTSPQFP